MIRFGERLKEVMASRGLTASKVAKELGLSNSNFTRYKSGERDPQLPKLVELADYLHVSMDYLYGLSDYDIYVGDLSKEQQELLYAVYTAMLQSNHAVDTVKVESINKSRIGRSHEYLYEGVQLSRGK